MRQDKRDITIKVIENKKINNKILAEYFARKYVVKKRDNQN
jgi:hypothetical protein